MELGIYSIRDKKIGYGDPIILNNDLLAMRAFEEWVNSPEVNQANQYIEDKEFYKIGKYDTTLGTITPENKFLATAVEVRTYDPVKGLKKRIDELEEKLLEEKQSKKVIQQTNLISTTTLKEEIEKLQDENNRLSKRNLELREKLGEDEDGEV